MCRMEGVGNASSYGLDQETNVVLKHCISARAALAELKQAAELIPNPGVLMRTLPLLEARASSEIENIVTTADDLPPMNDAIV